MWTLCINLFSCGFTADHLWFLEIHYPSTCAVFFCYWFNLTEFRRELNLSGCWGFEPCSVFESTACGTCIWNGAPGMQLPFLCSLICHYIIVVRVCLCQARAICLSLVSPESAVGRFWNVFFIEWLIVASHLHDSLTLIINYTYMWINCWAARTIKLFNMLSYIRMTDGFIKMKLARIVTFALEYEAPRKRPIVHWLPWKQIAVNISPIEIARCTESYFLSSEWYRATLGL